MTLIKSFSRRSFLWIILITAILSSLLIFTGFLEWRFIFSALPMTVLNDVASQSAEFKSGFDQVRPVINFLNQYFIFATIFIFTCFSIILWLILRNLFIRLLKNTGFNSDPKNKIVKTALVKEKISAKVSLKDRPIPGEEALSAFDKKENIEINQRLYLHILSVLQREGRLIDFFSEDLSRYDDAQIGVAVRNIHENCQKTLYKYLKPTAIIDKTEGEQISVPSDFDASAVKLIGNISGKPPFQGILRHKGWQVTRLELPTLTSGQNPRIIAPAEVEIL